MGDGNPDARVNSVADADHGSGPSTGEPSPKKQMHEPQDYSFQNEGHKNPQDVEKPDMAERGTKSKLDKELLDAETHQ